MQNVRMDLAEEHPVRVGQRIRAARISMGQDNAAAFARSAGITAQALNNWERGIGVPQFDNGLRLIKRFGVTLDWLYRGVTVGLPVETIIRLTEAEERLEVERSAGEPQ